MALKAVLRASVILFVLIFVGHLQAAEITESILDTQYRHVMKHAVIANPLEYGIPVGGDFLDPGLLTRDYRSRENWHIDSIQYTHHHFAYQGYALRNIGDTGPINLGDDFYDYVLSRMSDSGMRAGIRALMESAGVNAETIEHYTLAAERYFDLQDAESSARYHPDISGEERLYLITLAQQEAAASRKLFRAVMKHAIEEVAQQPEVRKAFVDTVLSDVGTAADNILGQFKRELRTAQAIRDAVTAAQPAAASFSVCGAKQSAFDMQRFWFSDQLFKAGNVHGIKSLRSTKAFTELLLAAEDLDGCVLALFDMLRDDKEGLSSIVTELPYGEAWSRSKKRIRYGDDLIFIDEIIKQAGTYYSAHGSPPLGLAPDVYLNDGDTKLPVIEEAIEELLNVRRQIISLKDREGIDASAGHLFGEAVSTEKKVFPGFDHWLASRVQQKPKLEVGVVNEAAQHRIQLGRIYIRQKDYETARRHLLAAVTLAPSDWKAWELYGSNAGFLKRRFESAQSYRRALDLVALCNKGSYPGCEKTFDSGADYGELLYAAGFAHIMIADYQNAAEFLSDACSTVPESLHSNCVEWLAVARFAGSDLLTAWEEYRKSFRGAPLPGFYKGDLDENRFRTRVDPPSAFLNMIRAGLIDLENYSYQETRKFARYLHVQNTARVEALSSTNEQAQQDTSDLLLDLYVELTRTERDRSGAVVAVVQPALSAYAVDMAEKAERAVDQGRYVEAERYYRAALQTDPWWLEGLENLSRLEFINWGYCGPGKTLGRILDVLKRGIGPQNTGPFAPNMYGSSVKDMEKMLRELLEESGRSGSGTIIGLCDKPGVTYIQPFKKLAPE